MKKLLLILLCLPIIGFGQCTVTSIDESSPGACDGSISVTVTGCPGPYTYSWSNGQATSSATGLCSGTYTVILTDANNNICCTETVTINVTVGITGCTDSLALNYDPTATIDDSSCVYCNLTAIVLFTTDVTCNGLCDGTATITPTGGCAPYAYLWDNGQVTSTAIGLCAGTYTCTVTDCNGCSYTTSVTITEPDVLTENITITNVTCNGLCDGTATTTPTGGCAPYTYLWNNGMVYYVLTDSNATAINLCAGTHTYTVTDCNGCSFTSSVTITEPLPLISYDTFSITTSIVWNGMTLTVSGNYSVTLTNAAGCDSIANLNLTVTTTGISDIANNKSNLVKITDMLGQETPYRKNTPLFYIYDDGAVEKRIVIE